MATLKKYNLTGKEVGTITVDDALLQAETNSQLIKDYITAIRANARQWSASTKTRAEVVHTTKKPHPQKHTGRARAGCLVAPQHRGGGIVFGPKPKFDQHVRINKKERQAAIRCLISEKIRDGKFIVVEDFAMKEPKTKNVAKFLEGFKTKGRTLFLGEVTSKTVEVDGKETSFTVSSTHHHNFQRSMKNIPKTEFRLAQGLSGYDVIIAGQMVVTEPALKQLVEWLA